MHKLLPCPFCGGGAEIEEIPEVGGRSGVTWSVGCGSADEEACPGYQLMTSWPTQKAAAVAWNKRVPEPTPSAPVSAPSPAGVPSSELGIQAKIRAFFVSNIGATRTECATALGIDRRTVWKHLKRMSAVPLLSPASGIREALGWVDRQIDVAKQVMKESARGGNGYANFAAHDAHKHLSAIRAALSSPATPEPVSAPAGEAKSLASRLREYVDNPHHVNPMSDRFRQAILQAAAALSNAPGQEVVPVAPAVREDIKAARTMLAGGDPLGAWQILDSLIAAHPAGEKEGRS